MMMIFLLVFNRKLLRCGVSSQVNAKQSWILDSGFWILRYGIWTPGTGFWIPYISETWIPDSNH